jgi:hypothetical protein
MEIHNMNSSATIQAGKLKGEKIRAFVCGHTGATGKKLMDILVASDYVESIVAVGRRINEKYANHPKVTQYVIPNMNELGKEDIAIAEGCNAAFCTIGTPFNDVFKKDKQDSYRSVDFGIATEFAKFARKAGVDFFATITGTGTNGTSQNNMYVVKRDVETLVQTLGFERIAFMRPAFLNRGKDASFTEKLMLPGVFGIPVAKVAANMLWAAINQTQAVQGYENKEIKANAKTLGI